MFKKLMITGCTLLLLTACGTGAAEENASKTNQQSTANEVDTTKNTNNESTARTNSSQSTANTPTTVDVTNPPVSLNEAVNIFKEAHPNAKVESVELDSDDGRLHYDFDGFDSTKEYETDIDAATGEIRENEVENDREDDEFLDFSAIISPAKAIEIASKQAEVEGLSPTGWSLEADDGKQKYTIEYDKNDPDDIEIKIDAVTEEILEVDID